MEQPADSTAVLEPRIYYVTLFISPIRCRFSSPFHAQRGAAHFSYSVDPPYPAFEPLVSLADNDLLLINDGKALRMISLSLGEDDRRSFCPASMELTGSTTARIHYSTLRVLALPFVWSALTLRRPQLQLQVSCFEADSLVARLIGTIPELRKHKCSQKRLTLLSFQSRPQPQAVLLLVGLFQPTELTDVRAIHSYCRYTVVFSLSPTTGTIKIAERFGVAIDTANTSLAQRLRMLDIDAYSVQSAQQLRSLEPLRNPASLPTCFSNRWIETTGHSLSILRHPLWPFVILKD